MGSASARSKMNTHSGMFNGKRMSRILFSEILGLMSIAIMIESWDINSMWSSAWTSAAHSKYRPNMGSAPQNLPSWWGKCCASRVERFLDLTAVSTIRNTSHIESQTNLGAFNRGPFFKRSIPFCWLRSNKCYWWHSGLLELFHNFR